MEINSHFEGRFTALLVERSEDGKRKVIMGRVEPNLSALARYKAIRP